ncbi:hypothetical protein M3Y98_00511000 [Aphelenchoides besseyi]|nr:hypothetical protein M3Y98_00511000 [Aphelenchoides besseyi]KAI6207852.1 hypothetical protein M3Y96_00052800 [Aphelenchoides besseyi]
MRDFVLLLPLFLFIDVEPRSTDDIVDLSASKHSIRLIRPSTLGVVLDKTEDLDFSFFHPPDLNCSYFVTVEFGSGCGFYMSNTEENNSSIGLGKLTFNVTFDSVVSVKPKVHEISSYPTTLRIHQGKLFSNEIEVGECKIVSKRFVSDSTSMKYVELKVDGSEFCLGELQFKLGTKILSKELNKTKADNELERYWTSFGIGAWSVSVAFVFGMVFGIGCCAISFFCSAVYITNKTRMAQKERMKAIQSVKLNVQPTAPGRKLNAKEQALSANYEQKVENEKSKSEKSSVSESVRHAVKKLNNIAKMAGNELSSGHAPQNTAQANEAEANKEPEQPNEVVQGPNKANHVAVQVEQSNQSAQQQPSQSGQQVENKSEQNVEKKAEIKVV